MIARRCLAGILRSTVTSNHAWGETFSSRRAVVGSSYTAWKKGSATYDGDKQGSPHVPSLNKEPGDATPGTISSRNQGFRANDEVSEAAGGRINPPLEKREWPRPAEIPFQPKIMNSVELVGRVGLPVHMETLPDGTACAVAILEHNKGEHNKGVLDLPILWIPVIFEGYLASVAACHLKENDLIHVSGHLSSDSPQILIESRESSLKVMARSLEFVEIRSQVKKDQPLLSKLDATQMSGKEKGLNSTKALWVDFVENPCNWIDKRNNKTKSSQPDFKCKLSGKALWIGSTTPAPALQALESPTFCDKLLKITEENLTITEKGFRPIVDEDFWKELVNDPSKWRDNRFDKRHPRAPDFKHKKTGKGLWLDSSPDWVRSRYPPAR